METPSVWNQKLNNLVIVKEINQAHTEFIEGDFQLLNHTRYVKAINKPPTITKNKAYLYQALVLKYPAKMARHKVVEIREASMV